MMSPWMLMRTFGVLSLLFLSGCATALPQGSSSDAAPAEPPSMAQQVRDLGVGLRFINSPVPDGATSPEVGAEFVYDRSFSANARRSPVGIEVWVFGERADFLSSDVGGPI